MVKKFINSILGLCIGLNKGKSLDGRLCKEYKYRSMKKLLSLVTIVLLMSCESKEEVEKAVEKGFITVSLGPRILRTETAPATIISIIQYELGDMG